MADRASTTLALPHAAAPDAATVNVAARLAATAQAMPDAVAVVMPAGRDRSGAWRYRSLTFRELDEDSDRLAFGLRSLGVRPGTRLALLVRPSIDFVSLVFALFKAGAVSILIDPGMGRRHLLACLDEAQPEGFVAIPVVQAVRTLLGRRYGRCRFNVTVGRRWFWGGMTIDRLRRAPWPGAQLYPTAASDPAAIIFTSGSTGPPKGVLYCHGNFDRQVCEIRDQYAIQPGGIDLAAFPLFGLFNAAMGVTTVIPAMDASRPAQVNPANIVAAVQDWRVTQAFASPAVWDRVGRYCQQRGQKLATVRRVLSAGAAVAPDVLRRMMACLPEGATMHTPYGATEALPVATIEAHEVLEETSARTHDGAGTCVGRRYPGIEWKVISIDDRPIASLDDARELPPGEIGELIVRGPVVTSGYVTRVEWNARSKIAGGASFWHRMGDVGYFDDRGRFWFCGRLSQRVVTARGTLFTEPCEAILNRHRDVYRTALVGVGQPGQMRPAIIAEPLPGKFPRGRRARERFVAELRAIGKSHRLTAEIDDYLLHRAFPVDVRHNSKIFRERLAAWARPRLG